MINSKSIRIAIKTAEVKLTKRKRSLENIKKEIDQLENEINKLNSIITGEFLNVIQMTPKDLLKLLENKDAVTLDDSKIIIYSQLEEAENIVSEGKCISERDLVK
ncbi:hypothetical protein [Acetoanaerobium noterae]|uniref:hypothetical protein n=1 Tax=Acetoanaerobium noterae TaxID=745369 RepID=UPI0028ACE332|nr:hypothetical protein [Acetoanaerobium noterae]